MKIVEVPQFGGPEMLQIKEHPDPTPQAGQVVLEVKAAGINYADVVAREGHYPNVKSAPFYPGYEVAGIVSAVGDGVTNVKVGDRVMGILAGMGGYATHAVLPAEMAIPLPDELDFAPATALLIQGLTAYFLLEVAELSHGKSVLISSAAGGLGLLAVQIAKLRGAGTVIGLASESKHGLVRQHGADAAIDYRQSGWAEQVLTATDGKGVDIYLDAQGDPATEGFDALAEKAHWLIFGGQAGSHNALTPERLGTLMWKNITLRGYVLFGDFANFGRVLDELMGWAVSGQLKLSAQAFPLDKVAAAHQAIADRKTTGKIVLEP